MLDLELSCPYCGKSLMDNDIELEGKPSVKLAIEHKDGKGTLHLCSVYSNYVTKSNMEVPQGETVKVLCPDCKANLSSATPCSKCGAKMVELRSLKGGVIKFCSRHGCKKHHLEFEDLETEMRAFYAAYDMFFVKEKT